MLNILWMEGDRDRRREGGRDGGGKGEARRNGERKGDEDRVTSLR